MLRKFPALQRTPSASAISLVQERFTINWNHGPPCSKIVINTKTETIEYEIQYKVFVSAGPMRLLRLYGLEAGSAQDHCSEHCSVWDLGDDSLSPIGLYEDEETGNISAKFPSLPADQFLARMRYQVPTFHFRCAIFRAFTHQLDLCSTSLCALMPQPADLAAVQTYQAGALADSRSCF